MLIPQPLPSQANPGAVAVFASLLEARTGQQIAPNRAWRIDTALTAVLSARGLATLDDLAAELLRGSDATLGDQIVDALLNQETSFFRDAGVIESAVAAIAELGGASPRVWSAGCATGQEPLSLAMAFAARDVMAHIVASDVSAAAIARAREGRYTQFEIQRGLPIRQMVRWFTESDGDWIAAPDLLARVSYRRQNIVADEPPPGGFDAIFCRNVLFYLAPALRTRVLDRIADALRPGGLLVLGAGETVIGQTERFTPSQRFRGCYEKTAPAPKVYIAR